MDNMNGQSGVDGTTQGAPEDRLVEPTTRKTFLKGAAVAGAGVTGLSALAPAAALAGGRYGRHDRHHRHDMHHQHEKQETPSSGPTAGDRQP
jgi:hypothetical protein